MPTQPALFRVLAIVLLAAVSACSPLVGRWAQPGVESVTQLEVRNDRWDDLTVYLEREGALLKLGTVPGLSSRLLNVPAVYLPNGGDVRLSASRPGSAAQATSVRFNLAPGQRIAWIAARTSGPTGVAVR